MTAEARADLLASPRGIAPELTLGAAASPSRVLVLDGIRGWASLAVLLFHMLPETNRAVLPELTQSWVYACFDGPLAVYVFFVLSGEALSTNYLRTHNIRTVHVLAARRYLRLSLPILMASLLVYAAMACGLAVQDQAAVYLRSGWLGGFLQFHPSLPGAFSYAFRDVYFNPPSGAHYLPFLWTMSIELLGSFVVFGMLALAHDMPQHERRSVYVACLLALLIFRPVLAGFVFGVLLGDLRLHGTMDWLRAQPRRRLVFVAAAVAIAVLLSSLRALAHHSATTRYYLREYLGHADDGQSGANPLLMYANALALLCIVFASRRLERFFCCGFSRFLGRISFPLYLVQFAVLITLTSGLVFLYIDPAQPDRSGLYAIAVASILASICIAWLFAGLERRILRLPNRLVTVVVSSNRHRNR